MSENFNPNYWITIFLMPIKKNLVPGSDIFLIIGSGNSEIDRKKGKKCVFLAFKNENFLQFPPNPAALKSCPKMYIFLYFK